MRALVVLLAACGGTAAPVAHPNLDAMTSSIATCPKTAPAIPTDLPGSPDWCLELHTPSGTRWWYSAPNYNLLLDSKGKALYRYVLQVRRSHKIADPRAIDLDNDGIDELLYQRTGTDEHGLTLVHLEVVSFADPSDPSGDQVQIAGKASGADKCSATWKLVDRDGGGKDISVTGDCDSSEGARTITYRLDGASLQRQP
jgi:hypothetical protein